jgi:hypothetical protein
MSHSYTEDAPRAASTGFVLVAVLSVAAVIVLLILAVVYYSGSSARIASDYTAVAAPANQALTTEVNGYTRNQHHDLAAAESDLRREVKTEVSFDQQLAGISFPSPAGARAAVLIKADQKRAKLIGLQARSTSLRELRSLDSSVQAASADVEAQVRLIRQDLSLPTSSGQLF